MNISLKLEHEQFIQSQIQNGKFMNADEVINEAFKLLARKCRLEELRQKIANGQVTDGEVVFARLQEKLARIAEMGAFFRYFQAKSWLPQEG